MERIEKRGIWYSKSGTIIKMEENFLNVIIWNKDNNKIILVIWNKDNKKIILNKQDDLVFVIAKWVFIT